jgi:hypothetical protein
LHILTRTLQLHRIAGDAEHSAAQQQDLFVINRADKVGLHFIHPNLHPRSNLPTHHTQTYPNLPKPKFTMSSVRRIGVCVYFNFLKRRRGLNLFSRCFVKKSVSCSGKIAHSWTDNDRITGNESPVISLSPMPVLIVSSDALLALRKIASVDTYHFSGRHDGRSEAARLSDYFKTRSFLTLLTPLTVDATATALSAVCVESTKPLSCTTPS